MLLWEKDTNVPPTYHGVRYWVSTDGTSSAPTEATKIFQTTVSTNEITDIFCYDQEGNLYILWKESTVYCVTRFELKNGTYDFTQGQQLNLGISDEVVAIATDVSDGQKFLYCAAKKTSTTYKIKQWQWDSTFTGAPSTAYNITLPSGKKVTALAANKDGVFVATKEQETHPVVAPYTLKIKKYTKDTGTLVGEKAIATHEGGDEAHTPLASYKNNDGTVNSLQVVNGVLYAITSKITKTMKNNGTYVPDEFRSNGILYKVGNTEGSLSGTASELGKKEADDVAKTGYGFYRFIAVKPKKLVIASDSAWGQKGTETSFDKEDTDTVLEYDLAGVLGNPKNAGGTFSEQLLRTSTGCGFSWK